MPLWLPTWATASLDRFVEAYLIMEKAIDTRSVEPLTGVSWTTLLAMVVVQCFGFALLLCVTARGRKWVFMVVETVLASVATLLLLGIVCALPLGAMYLIFLAGVYLAGISRAGV